MNSNQPLGLPNGSIRAILTLAITGVALYEFVATTKIPESLLGVFLVVIGNYFGARGAQDGQPVPEEVAKPYSSEDDADL